jgi:hypothetical protein
MFDLQSTSWRMDRFLGQPDRLILQTLIKADFPGGILIGRVSELAFIYSLHSISEVGIL